MVNILNVVGSIASILGFSLQTFDSLNKGIRSADQKSIEEINNILQALVFIRNPAKAWKDLHVRYSALRSSFSHIYETLTDSDGNPVSYNSIAPAKLRNLFQNTVMITGIYNLEPELKTSVDTLRIIQKRRNATEEEYEKLIERGGVYCELAQSCRRLNDSLDNALKKHQQICEYLARVKEYNEKDQWDMESVQFIVNNRILCGSAIDNMITYSDGAVMSLLDIYISIVAEIDAKLN